jgi:hypothetical protein
MLWWEWNIRKRLALMAAMMSIAATPWLLVGWLTKDWRGLVGGTAFLFIPQIVGWLLFVGLKTNRMPSAYGRSEVRSESPTWFWLTGGMYAALLLLFLWIIVGVAAGGPILGF